MERDGFVVTVDVDNEKEAAVAKKLQEAGGTNVSVLRDEANEHYDN